MSKQNSKFEISSSDFEQLVRDQLGFTRYSYRDAEDWNTCTRKNIDGKLDMFDVGVLEQYKNQLSRSLPPRYTLSTLLNKLCAYGVLEPGDYTIKYED